MGTRSIFTPVEWEQEVNLCRNKSYPKQTDRGTPNSDIKNTLSSSDKGWYVCTRRKKKNWVIQMVRRLGELDPKKKGNTGGLNGTAIERKAY